MLTYSVGEMIDKLSIINLKIWHIEEQICGSLTENKTEELCDQVVNLNAARVAIIASIDEKLETNDGPIS